MWKCDHRCPWLVYHVCATSRALEQGGLGVLPGQEMHAVVFKLTEQTPAQTRGAASCSGEVVLANVRNSGSLVKGVEPGLSQYYGNTLSCGHIVFAMPTVDRESLTQVACSPQFARGQ